MIASLWDIRRPPTFPRFIIPEHQGSQSRQENAAHKTLLFGNKFWISKRGSVMTGHKLLSSFTRIHLLIPFYVLVNNTQTHTHTHLSPPPHKNICYSLPSALTKYLICTQTRFTECNIVKSYQPQYATPEGGVCVCVCVCVCVSFSHLHTT